MATTRCVVSVLIQPKYKFHSVSHTESDPRALIFNSLFSECNRPHAAEELEDEAVRTGGINSKPYGSNLYLRAGR